MLQNINAYSKKPAKEFKCVECTRSKGKPITFKSAKSLQRHLTRTKAHNAQPVLRCSCGVKVVRRDAIGMHRKYCRGRTEPLDDDAGTEG